MLGATQKQLFDMQGNEITGFKPYQPYSKNVDDYVAPFSPLQQQAMQATGQLQTPGQFGDATTLAGVSGLGSLGAAQQAMGAGQQYAQMAQDPRAMQGYMSPYMQNVVDYQKAQAARDYNIGQGVRKSQAVGQGAFGGSRQAIMESEAQRSLGNQLQGITATGSQKAFEDAQRQQQFGAQLGMQGLQTGLQGYGQMGQAASTLGDLGNKQLAAQQGIIQSKYGMGQQQQAMEQQKINQAMQDWANTQQYPLMQLGVMSNMLRGLPMQASTTNQYQAAPNALTQGIGAAGAGASLYNALKGGKEGGLPSEFKPTTGIKSYYEGEVVESTKSDLYDLSLEELDKRAKSSPSPTIKRLATAIAKEKRMGLAGGGIIAFANPNEANNQGVVREDPELVRRAYIDAAKLKQNEIPENLRYDPEKIATQDQLIKDVGSQLNRTPAPVSIRDSGGQGITEDTFKRIAARDYSGIAGATPNTAAAPAPAAAPKTDIAKQDSKPAPTAPPPADVKPSAVVSAPADVKPPAPAGIKAAAPAAATTGIKVPGLEEPAADPYAKMTIEEIAAKKLAFLGGDVRKEERAGLMAERANAKDEARRAQSLRMAEFFAAWGSTPGSTITAGLTALKAKLPDIITDSREEAKIRRAINKDIAALDKADRLEKSGAWDEAAKIKQDQSKNAYNVWGKKVDFASARMSDDAKIRAAQIGADARTTGKDDLAALEARLNTANANITAWQDKNSSLVRRANRTNPNNDKDIQKGIDAAKKQLNDNEQYQALIRDRDAIRRVIETSPRVQTANKGDANKSGTPAPSAGKVIQYDKDGNRI
jgi:soluble cytochrome b562